MKKKIILFFTIIFVLVGSFFVYKKFFDSDTTFEDVLVERADISLVILATGTVQPENRLEIKPPVPGRVEEVLVQEGQKVTKGQTLAWMSSNERAALIDAARSQGLKEVKKWEELFRPTPIIAPINGTIILRGVEEGQSFTTQDPILVMSDRLTVKAQVDETDMALIRLKQKAEIILDAYPNTKIDAIVDEIAFEAKTVNNVTTYIIDVLPTETPELMRSGMTANVTFFIQKKSNVLSIPSELINMDTKPHKILNRNKLGEIEEKEIETGISDGKRTEIIKGLSDGEIVIREVKGKSKSSDSTNPFSPMRKKKEKTEKKQ